MLVFNSKEAKTNKKKTKNRANKMAENLIVLFN